jgi:hypothetical protein
VPCDGLCAPRAPRRIFRQDDWVSSRFMIRVSYGTGWEADGRQGDRSAGLAPPIAQTEVAV